MGTLSYHNSKFYFVAESFLSEEHDLARNAGLKFDADSLRWVTRNFDKARRLRRFADVSAERKLKNHFITDFAPPECIIYPDHLAPKPLQIESAWHCLTRTPCYVADEAGLGKTITAVMAMNSARGKTLIICPPYLKYNWQDELNLWASDWYRQIQGVLIQFVDSEVELGISTDVFILPDSLLCNHKVLEKLKAAGPFKWLIVDEAHRYKTDTAQRTAALLGDEKHVGITALAERTVLLSGTPIPNGRPIELFPVLSRLAPESISHRNAEQYWKEFCGGKSVTHYEGRRAVVHRDLNGASNLAALQNELMAKFMIRHLQRDHLKELKPKTRRLIFLDTPDKIMRLERECFEDYTLEEIMGGDFKLGDIARYRKQVGQAKIKGAIEFIKDILDYSDGKLVVSAYHINVVEELVAQLKLYGALKIRGGMKTKDKHANVKAFQNDPRHRVIVGNTLSMGLGNTLTRAPRMVSIEPEWGPGVNEQMEDRIHRISQEKHVYCDYLALRGSLDERMLRQALGKEYNIQQMMN